MKINLLDLSVRWKLLKLLFINDIRLVIVIINADSVQNKIFPKFPFQSGTLVFTT